MTMKLCRWILFQHPVSLEIVIISFDLFFLQIRYVDELDKIKGMKSLRKLMLEGNPRCSKYQHNDAGFVR